MLQLPGLRFDHGEDIAALRAAVATFAAAEIAPRAAQIDRDDQFPAAGAHRLSKHLAVRIGDRVIYSGTTSFGFFSKKALAEQVGVRGAKPYTPSPAELERGWGR